MREVQTSLVYQACPTMLDLGGSPSLSVVKVSKNLATWHVVSDLYPSACALYGESGLKSVFTGV